VLRVAAELNRVVSGCGVRARYFVVGVELKNYGKMINYDKVVKNEVEG